MLVEQGAQIRGSYRIWLTNLSEICYDQSILDKGIILPLNPINEHS